MLYRGVQETIAGQLHPACWQQTYIAGAFIYEIFLFIIVVAFLALVAPIGCATIVSISFVLLMEENYLGVITLRWDIDPCFVLEDYQATGTNEVSASIKR